MTQLSSKAASNDRVFALKVKDGSKPTSSTGLVDTRLFTGENNLHAIRDERNCIWYLQYDMGGLPPPLKQRFTNFQALVDHVKRYFATRNIEVVSISD